MFSKLALFTAATMAVFVAASSKGGRLEDACNAGIVQCCNTLASKDTAGISELCGLVGLDVEDITGQIGVACTPISLAAVGQGSSCTSQPVCCTDNSYNGVVAVGCTPINVAI